jgi:hypothetical protein
MFEYILNIKGGLLFYLPVMLANLGVFLFIQFLASSSNRKKFEFLFFPIDFYHKIKKKRLIGDGRPLIGLFLFVIFSLVFNHFTHSVNTISEIIVLSLGAELGTVLNSFVKRRFDVKNSIIMDHTDVVLGSTLLYFLFWPLPLSIFIGGLISYFLIHLFINLVIRKRIEILLFVKKERAILLKTVLLALIVVFFVLFFGNLKTLSHLNYSWFFLAILLSILFVLSKAGIIYFILKDKKRTSYFESIIYFLKSVAAGVLTFTSKVGFFSSLFIQMNKKSKKNSFKPVILYALYNLLGILFFIPIFFPIDIKYKLICMLVIFIFSVILLSKAFKQKNSVGLAFLSTAAYLLDYAQIFCVGLAFGIRPELSFFGIIIISETARAISQIPLGLGVTDSILYVFLTGKGYSINFPLFLLAVRLFGELLTSFFGVLVLIKENFIKNGKREK